MKRIMTAGRAVISSVVTCALVGCATVTRGTRTEFAVESEPPGAGVTTGSGLFCAATPCKMKLPRNGAFDLTISKAGYKAQTVHVESKVQGGGMVGVAGNAVLGGLIGIAVDVSDGASKDLVPNPVRVTLQPAANLAPAGLPSVSTPSTLVASAPSPTETQNYQLAIGDKLHIVTFDEPQLSGDFVVGDDGLVSLLWIGGVPAQGRTAEQVRADIEARLKDGYILHPTVSLQVLASRPFYILGEVNKPGQYPYTDGLSVMSAVATAGGFTYRANTKTAFVKHVGDGYEQDEPLTATTQVRAGDTIRIGERFF